MKKNMQIRTKIKAGQNVCLRDADATHRNLEQAMMSIETCVNGNPVACSNVTQAAYAAAGSSRNMRNDCT